MTTPSVSRLRIDRAETVENDAVAEVALDRSLFCATILLLTCFGIVTVHTSSVTTRQDGFEPIYLTRHLVHLVVAAIVLVGAATRRVSFWRSFATPFGFLVLLLLSLVFVPGFGLTAGGATRWLRLPGFSVQPSEWAKLAIPLVVAAQLTTHRVATHRNSRSQVGMVGRRLLSAGVVLGSVALVLKQPDLGTSLLLMTAAVVSLWLAGVRLRWFVVAAVGVIPLGAMLTLKGYQIRRITGLIDTWRDWHEAPYQLRQSLIALGEGGPSGVGLGRGWQKLSFLPESHTDFVVAVVGEELGFVGIAVLTTLWVTLFFAGLSMSNRCADHFGEVVSRTLLTMVVLQAALNVAVVSAVVPPTGIPHPLLSYGGNSLIVTAIALGIVWSASSSSVALEAARSAPGTTMSRPLVELGRLPAECDDSAQELPPSETAA